MEQEQLKYLENEVMYGSNKEQFKVIDIEAGLGKSLKTEEALAELYNINPKVKSIYVKMFKKNNDLVQSRDNINKQAGKNIAIDIESNNFNKYKNMLDDYNVIIITHQMYIQLCKKPEKRVLITEGRTNLIIDEQIDMLNIYDYNIERIEWFYNLLPESINGLYLDCVSEIKKFLKGKGKFFNARDKKENELDKLKMLIENKINQSYAKKCIYRYTDEWGEQERRMKKHDFLEEVEIVRSFLKNTTIRDETNMLHAFDYRNYYWMLNNNILLDATGSINELYRISPLFQVQRQAKLTDYKHWTIHLTEANTTKNGKSNIDNYYEEVITHIKQVVNSDDKMLVLGAKDEERDFEDIFSDNISFAYFGNMKGRNDWRDYNKIYVTHLPNKPFYVYILEYIFYTDKKLTDRTKTGLMKKGITGGFINPKFEKIRVSHLVSELYQGIKRINRDNQKQTDVYLLIPDFEIFQEIFKRMLGIKIEMFELNLVPENTYADRFIALLKGKDKGKYRKKNLREELGIENKSFFKNKVLNNQRVRQFFKLKNIKDNGQYIII